MKEYTSLVEKMSKDVFDSTFLKNFQLFTPQQQPNMSNLEWNNDNPNF